MQGSPDKLAPFSSFKTLEAASPTTLTCERSPAPPDVGPIDVEEVDVDSVLRDAELGEQIGDGRGDLPVRILPNRADGVEAAEGGGLVRAAKNHVGLVGDRHGFFERQ